MEKSSILAPQAPNASATDPTTDAATLCLSDFFDLQKIQQIQDAFAAATGMAMVITDTAGKMITEPSNFCRLCKMIRATKIGAENCLHSDV